MPTSHWHQLNEIVELMVITNPRSILDIGVGFGKFGYLAREYLEIWCGSGKYNKWDRQIDGIEIFKDYILPIHELIYDHLFIGNAIDIVPNLENKYDLILLIDIIEHFDFEEGMKLLELCRKVGRNIIISTPYDIGVQGEAFDNPHEAHEFQWKEVHFNRFSDKFFVPNHFSIICYMGEKASYTKRLYRNNSIKRRFPFLITPYKFVKLLFKL